MKPGHGPGSGAATGCWTPRTPILRLDSAGPTGHLLCVVHDEVVHSAPTEDYHDIAHQVLDCQTFPGAPPRSDRRIRIAATLGKRPGRNWSDVYE